MKGGINFLKVGSGSPVILIHGFPMSHHVWEGIIGILQNHFTVYTPDLPGFGDSVPPPENFTLKDVARALNQWVEEQGIQNASLVGHSLGGYVALEMVKEAPWEFRSLVLFHSTALADSQEKKDSRTKVLKFIDDNGVEAFTSNFIEPLFAEPKHPAISAVKAISVKATAPVVKGYTRAMRDRADNSIVLRNFGNPILIIGGEHDKGIPADSLRDQANLRQGIELTLLDSSAHMGMFEQEQAVVDRLIAFLS